MLAKRDFNLQAIHVGGALTEPTKESKAALTAQNFFRIRTEPHVWHKV